jgi:hypothetical protein
MSAQFRYFDSRAAALAAAPAGEPYTVVDILTRPTLTFPSIPEIIRRTRYIPGDEPYRAPAKGDHTRFW